MIFVVLLAAWWLEPHITAVLTRQPRQGRIFGPSEHQPVPSRAIATGWTQPAPATPMPAHAAVPAGAQRGRTTVRVGRASTKGTSARNPHRGPSGTPAPPRQVPPGTPAPGAPSGIPGHPPGTPLGGTPGTPAWGTPGALPGDTRTVIDKRYTFRWGRIQKTPPDPPRVPPQAPPGGTQAPPPTPTPTPTGGATTPPAPATQPSPTVTEPIPTQPSTPTPPVPISTAPDPLQKETTVPMVDTAAASQQAAPETIPAHVEAGKTIAGILRETADQLSATLTGIIRANMVQTGEALQIRGEVLGPWTDAADALDPVVSGLTNAADLAEAAAANEEALLRPVIEHASEAPLESGATVGNLRAS